MIQQQEQRIKLEIKDQLEYMEVHAVELVWYQLNSFLYPIPSNSENARSTEMKSHYWLRLFWRMIRPMTYDWLGDLGWHLFKLWFKRWFKKKERRTSN